MAPDKQWVPPIHLAMIAAIGEVWDAVTHKTLLAIAGAAITVLLYWGFNQTFGRLDKIEAKQDLARQEFLTEANKLAGRDVEHDRCIAILTERQNGVLKVLDDLKQKH